MSDKFPSQMQDKFTIRFPEGMRDKIAEIAKKNNRSMNSEIILALEKHIESKNKTTLMSYSFEQEFDLSEFEKTLRNTALKFKNIFSEENIKNMVKVAQTQAKLIKNTPKKGVKDENDE